MNDSDKGVIFKNLENLVQLTKYSELINRCLQMRIITPSMRDKIEDINKLEEDRHKALFIKITKRGPTAFQDLKKVLVKNNFKDALKILNGSEVVVLDIKVDTPHEKLLEYDGEVLKRFTINRSNKINLPCENDWEKEMGSEKSFRGVLLLVNYTTNRGEKANQEKDYLISIFKELNFHIFYVENKSIGELEICFTDLKRYYFQQLKPYCFFYIQLGNASMNTLFFDHSKMSKHNLLSNFNNVNCGELYNIPKIFIFPSVNPKNLKSLDEESIEFVKSQPDDKTKLSIKATLEQTVPTTSKQLYFHFELSESENSFLSSICCFCSILEEYAYKETLQKMIKLYHKERKFEPYSTYRECNDLGFKQNFTFREPDSDPTNS